MCGIAGAYGVENAAVVVSQMLKLLQHRGQEAAGITSSDGEQLFMHKGTGLADEVFNGFDFEKDLPGTSAIGHLRYATSGDPGSKESIQPLLAVLRHDQQIALVHNGNLTNDRPLRERLQESGAIFRSQSDTEIFLHLVARALASEMPLKFREAFTAIEGAYAMLAISTEAMYAAVDPYGFRPLVIAEYKGGWLFASETCALDLFRLVGKQVDPGKFIEITKAGIRFTTFEEQEQTRHCSFEHIYFSRPDSKVFGKSVYDIRVALGRQLARKLTLTPEDRENAIAIAVPDSSNIEALAFAKQLGIPFEFGIIRNHYSGRTFITPKQKQRELGVRMKFNVVSSVVSGRDVYLIDDSIVRGTTAEKVVRLLREAGAKTIHMCVASPPVVHTCHWGIDTHSRDQLAAADATIEEIRIKIGVESLTYLTPVELQVELKDQTGKRYCTTCFTGKLPIEGRLIASEHLLRRAKA